MTAIDVKPASELARSNVSRSRSPQTVARRNVLGRKQRFEARRVRRIIRHVDPWSMLKLSLVFFICVWVMFMVAVVIIWSIAQSSGTVEKIESFVSDLGVTGRRTRAVWLIVAYAVGVAVALGNASLPIAVWLGVLA